MHSYGRPESGSASQGLGTPRGAHGSGFASVIPGRLPVVGLRLGNEAFSVLSLLTLETKDRLVSFHCGKRRGCGPPSQCTLCLGMLVASFEPCGSLRIGVVRPCEGSHKELTGELGLSRSEPGDLSMTVSVADRRGANFRLRPHGGFGCPCFHSRPPWQGVAGTFKRE